MLWFLRIVTFVFLIRGMTAAPVGNNSYDFRVRHGKLAVRGQFPYQISLLYRRRHICGGSIIGEKRILTAAHCVIQNGRHMPPREYSVLAGTISRLDFMNPDAKHMRVQRILVHPKNRQTNKLAYDYALLYMPSPLYSNTSSKPIASVPLAQTAPRVGDACVVSGWGKTETGEVPRMMRFATVYVQNKQRCAAAYGKWSLPRQHICAKGRSGESSDSGDSGGPLVCSGVLAGVVSYGHMFNKRAPAVYASVAAELDWVVNRGYSVLRDDLRQRFVWEWLLVMVLFLNGNIWMLFYFEDNNKQLGILYLLIY